MMVQDLNVRLVAVWTQSGDTARLLSKHHLDCPIVAFTPHEHVCRQMALLYGVVPIHYQPSSRLDQMLEDFDRILLERNLTAVGDSIVVVAHTRPDLPGETEVLFAHVVGLGKGPRTTERSPATGA